MNRAEAPFQRRHPLSTTARPAGTFLGPEKQRVPPWGILIPAGTPLPCNDTKKQSSVPGPSAGGGFPSLAGPLFYVRAAGNASF